MLNVIYLQSPLGHWQARNWDPQVGTTGWDDFCAALDGNFVADPDLEFAVYDERQKMVVLSENLMVPVPVYNYAQYIKLVSAIHAD